MKKRAIIILLVCSIFLCIVLPLSSKSYADPFTASQIGAAAYAAMTSWGISFTAGAGTGVGVSNFMENELNSYVNASGSSLIEKFGSDLAIDAAGKLVMGFNMYNGVVDFANWLREKYDLSSVTADLVSGFYKGTPMGVDITGSEQTVIPSEGCGVIYRGWSETSQGYKGYSGWQAYNAGAGFGWRGGSNLLFTGEYNLRRSNYVLVADIFYLDTRSGSTGIVSQNLATISEGDVTGSLRWSGQDFVEPTVLNPDKQWTGTIGGASTPDTNLDQLLGDIYDNVADNNLMVDGEVIDVPVPPGPVPTWTPVDDVIDGINGLGEELDGIGQDIGDISGHLDDIGDQVGDIGEQIGDVTGALEGVQQGIQTQTGVISGAMDQAAQDVADAIGSQTAALDESLTATAEGIQDITDILTAPQIDTPKFDLRELFPFCIPFDIYHLLQKFDGTPAAPHVQLPIVIPSIGFSYTLDLDFSAWDPVAAAMRTVELIVYTLGLAWATSKAIKW